MSKKNRTDLKNYFSTGKIPTQQQYGDFIDSFLSLEDSDTQIIQGTISSSRLALGGHITASQNISASGTIFTNRIIAGEATNFTPMNIAQQTDYDAGHQFVGDITASAGNISSSGTIFAHDISASGHLSVQGSSSFYGDITASGYVSSSHLIAETLTVHKIRGGSPIHFADSMIISASVTASADVKIGNIIFDKVNSLIKNADFDSNSKSKITDLTKLNVTGYITGSGVSSSATIYAPDAQFGNTTVYINENHITASGNVSASGEFIGSSANITNITASSGISASGTITTDSIVLGGNRFRLINDNFDIMDGGLEVNGNVTASGNISASGEIVGDYRRLIQTKTSAGALVIGDAGTYNRCGSHILTIPLNSAVAFTTGTEIEFIQSSSTGHLMITASAGQAVTINSRNTLYSSSGQFSAISIKKVGTDEWDMIGDLTS